jgi:hypothetical protein
MTDREALEQLRNGLDRSDISPMGRIAIAQSIIGRALASTPTVADDGKLVDEDAAWLRDSARWLRMVGIGAHRADRLERIATRLEQHGGHNA